jgi:hypothetical protein
MKKSSFFHSNLILFSRKNLCSISKRTEWISTENRYLLCEEIIFLRKKLYGAYDDISSLLSQNQTLENSIRQQKQQLSLYQQKFKYTIEIEIFISNFFSLVI